MPGSSLPQIVGFTPLTAHDCVRCDKLVRIMYQQTSSGPEREGKHYQTFREQRYPGGAMLVAWSHREADYAYYIYQQNKGCGFVVPIADDKPESFVQQIYAHLFQYPATPAERIVRFDPAAFLAAPFVSQALPRDPSHPKLALLANRMVMRVILVTGQTPGPDGVVPTLDPKQLKEAPEAFLRAIHAETVKIQV